MNDENRQFAEYLKESSVMILQNKKTPRQVFEECRFFLPSLISYLPIEIKALIINFVINKRKNVPLFDSITLFKENFQTILAFCGIDYHKVVECIFKKSPALYHRFYYTRMKKLKAVVDNINDEDIMIYAKFRLKTGQLSSKKWILKICDTNFFDFKLLDKKCLDAKTLYFHKSSSTQSSFSNYFREGFWFGNEFRTVHYVNHAHIIKLKL